MNSLIKIGAVVAVAAGLSTAPAYADVFDMCPDGQEGVVGGHTTCDFADNVRSAYYASGKLNDFVAYSPVTEERYEMSCESGYSARFSNGAVVTSTRCFGGENAEVVIW
jgi:hypothetical protein